jgi:hypothetical protein
MRPCGDCRLCCKLVGIDELQKPPGRWCEHCNPKDGPGCRIYENRPRECATFKCAYTEGLVEIPPHKSKALLWTQSCPMEGVERLRSYGINIPVIDGVGVLLTCHEDKPGAARTGEVASHIERSLQRGYAVLIVPRDQPRYLVFAKEGKLITIEAELENEVPAE